MLDYKRNVFCIACVIATICFCILTLQLTQSHQLYPLRGVQQKIKLTNNWTYYPSDYKRAKYGILMAGTPKMFYRNKVKYTVSEYSTCIAQLYARHHGYAFVVEKDLGAVSNRSYGNCSSLQMSPWNKIALMRQYLSDVDVLLWVDLDGVFQNFNRSLEEVLPEETAHLGRCRPTIHYMGYALGKYPFRDLPGSETPFLWLSSDFSYKYAVNVNSAVFALRRGQIAFDFLEAVWRVGDDHESFKKHDPYWKLKDPCVGYWGWPWEQGGIWDVLSGTNRSYLRATCVLPNVGVTGLNSVIDQSKGPGAGDDPVFNKNGPLIVHHPNHAANDWMTRHIRDSSISTADCESICGIVHEPGRSMIQSDTA